MSRALRLTCLAAILIPAFAVPASAQFGSLVSPGPLARAHASLEGAANCEKCHERGRKVTAEKCLVCHKPIADRIALKTGVHRSVTTDCIGCHVEHAGVDGELRPFDRAKFNHAVDTRFPIDGKHAPLSAKCESCHKTRSFLTAPTACASCHTDVHKGSLGNACERCHSTKVAFSAAINAFDHSVTPFPLVGAHATVACAKCHSAPGSKIAKFAACMDCHATPHTKAVSTQCTTCHGNDNWRTKTFDHTKTAFPLAGKHAVVLCTACHKQPPMKAKPPASTCATCHIDPHKGEFASDCKSCHSESGFAGATFDHASTKFALTDGHAKVACISCHRALSAKDVKTPQKSLDFRVVNKTCATCHSDPHQGELGTTCDTCHSAKTFVVSTFAHPRAKELFVGKHAVLLCVNCHQPKAAAAGAATKLATASFTTTPSACASCHRDPHLGQLSADCQSCHSAAAPTFAAGGFSHERGTFQLTGAHQKVPCANCHKAETADFPSGRGQTTRYKGLKVACASCHQDVHLGQLASACESCHNVNAFRVAKYTHQSPEPGFFAGRHRSAACVDCHKRATANFPSGKGTAVQFKITTDCVTCHADPHSGSLGRDCGRCHKPQPLVPAHLPSHRAEAL